MRYIYNDSVLNRNKWKDAYGMHVHYLTGCARRRPIPAEQHQSLLNIMAHHVMMTSLHTG